MTFVQLQQLLEIHRAASISQAAKNLFVSQPSISLTLKALEDELGFPIFLRTRKGLIPTLQGINVIDHAARICESYRLLTTPEMQKSTSLRISTISFPPIHSSFLRLVEENKSRRDITFSLTQENEAFEQLMNFALEIGFILKLSTTYLSFLDDIQKMGLHASVVATLPGAIRIGKGHPQFANVHASPADSAKTICCSTVKMPRFPKDCWLAALHASNRIITSFAVNFSPVKSLYVEALLMISPITCQRM